MSAETALYAVLSAYAPLTALVSTRIFPDAIPEDKALPAVVYGNEGATPEMCLEQQHRRHQYPLPHRRLGHHAHGGQRRSATRSSRR